MSFVNSGVSRFAMIVALSGTFALAGCSPSDRTMSTTALGAGIGALAGAASGGKAGNVLAGAAIGAAAGLLIGLVLDEIERQEMQAAYAAAARSGGSSSRSFRNKSGKAVQIKTRTTKTYSCGETRCRELTASVTRDGQTQTETKRVREVKAASGSQWVDE